MNKRKSRSEYFFKTLFEKQSSLILFLAVFSLYILLRLWNVTVYDLWFDEVFSVVTVRSIWAEMFSALISDAVHPPLFYILLKLWSLLDDSVWWLQLFPFLVSIFTLIPLHLLARELKLNNLATALSIFMIAVNDYFLEYALDLRMYGLLQFFALFSLWLFVKLLESKDARRSTLVFLTLINFLLVYTHYFGWLVVGFEGIYVLFCKRRLLYSYFISCVVILLSFAPWIWLVLRDAAERQPTGDLDWISRPSISDLMWAYTTFNGNLNLPKTTFINLLIFGFPIVFVFWRKIYKRESDSSWQILFVFAFFPVALIFSLSHLLPKSIWEMRYLIIAAVPYILLLAKSSFDLRNKLARRIFITLILIWSLFAGFVNFQRSPSKVSWSEVANHIGENQTNQPIYVFEKWVAAPLQFYVSQQKTAAQVEKRKTINEITDKDFWLAFRITNSAENIAMRESLYAKKCRIVQENIYPASSQNVVLFDVRDCK